MNFTFSKEIRDYNLSGYGRLYWCRLYKIFDGDTIIGQFLHTDVVAFFTYGEMDLRIDLKKKFLTKTKHIIVDQKKDTEIGSFQIKYPNNNLKSSGKMTIGNEIYTTLTLPTDIKSRLFKKETWGSYKVKIFSETEEVIYSLKHEVSWFQSKSDFRSPAKGYIELSSENLLVLFAGLYLLDETLWVASKRAIFEIK
jgi:hypothetical protein